MAHIDFWLSPRAGGECANRGRSGGRGIARTAQAEGAEGWGDRPDRQASARHAWETVQPLSRGGRRPLHPQRRYGGAENNPAGVEELDFGP